MIVSPLQALWDSVADGSVYLVAERGDMPYLEPPITVDPDDVPEDYDHMREAAFLMVFNLPEGADGYRQFLVNERDLSGHHLKVIKLTVTDLWSLIDEMAKVAHDEWGALFKIDLFYAQKGGEILASDTIYSQVEEYH